MLLEFALYSCFSGEQIHKVLCTHLRSSQVILVELHPNHLEISFFYKNLKKNKAGTVFIGSLQVCQDVYMDVWNV